MTTSIGTAVVDSIACGKALTSYSITYKYAIGSHLWSRPHALKGVMEPLVIKDVKITIYNVLYIDTFNGYWNEDELCSEAIARDLAVKYWERQKEILFQAMKLEC